MILKILQIFKQFHDFLDPKRYVRTTGGRPIGKNIPKSANFMISYFGEFLTKTLRNKCVWKPLTDTLHFCNLRASPNMSRASTGIFCKGSNICNFAWIFGDNVANMHVHAREMLVHARKLQNLKILTLGFQTHQLLCFLDKQLRRNHNSKIKEFCQFQALRRNLATWDSSW